MTSTQLKYLKFAKSELHSEVIPAIKQNNTLVIVPAFNEGWNIESLIDEIHGKGHLDILVVNDSSNDNTETIARKTKKAHVITLPHNLGIGGAVQTGFKFAAKFGYDYVLQVDADGQHIVDEIPRLLKLVKLGKSDVAIGSRFNKKHRGYKSSFTRRIGIKILEWIGMILINQRISDTTSGFRAYNKKAVNFLAKSYPTDYPEPEAIILLGKSGFKMSEVFTEMKAREGGKSSISKNGVFYMIKVTLGMIMTYMRPKSLR